MGWNGLRFYFLLYTAITISLWATGSQFCTVTVPQSDYGTGTVPVA